MKKFMVLLLGLLVAIFLAACGDNNGGDANNGNDGNNGNADTNANENANDNANEGNVGEDITLRIAWWGGQPRHDLTQEVIDLYTAENPNVTIEPEFAEWGDYWQRLAPQAAASELPDIIQMDLSYISQYAENNQLADLTPLIGKQIDVSDIADTIVSGGTVGDGIYGFNTGVNAVGFHYDPATLASIGYDEIPDDWTWDTFIEMGDAAAEAGVFFDTGMAPDVFFNYYLRQQGERLYAEDGSGLGYDDDQLFVDFFGMYQERIEKGATPRPDDLNQNAGIEDNPVVKGEAVGVWQWSNQFVGIQSVADQTLEMAPMPGPNASDGLFLKPSMFWSVAENSNHKEAAADFIDFFINNIEANKIIDGDRGVPGSSVVKDSLREGLDEEQAKVFDYIEYSEENSSPMGAPDPAQAGEIIDLISRITEEISYLQTTPEDGAVNFRSEAESIFSN